MNFNDISAKAGNVYAAIKELNEQSIEWMKEVLSKRPEKSVKVPEDADGIDLFCVPYDGGSHPEYASNVFAYVENIYLDKKGNIMLDTDEATGYPLSDAQGASGGLLTYELADFMHGILKLEGNGNQ